MKRIFTLILLFLFFSVNSKSQSVTATYSVKISHPSGYEIPYEGRLFHHGNQTATYLYPLYLDEFPDGWVKHDGKILVQSTDTAQNYAVVSLDSNMLRTADQWGNRLIRFEAGNLVWELLPETRVINGIRCQRAVWIARDKPAGEIWFAPEIPVSSTFFNLLGAPGLVMAMDFYGFARAEIKTIEYNAALPQDVFWPEVFNKIPFKE